jgi:hypothetical protein
LANQSQTSFDSLDINQISHICICPTGLLSTFIHLIFRYQRLDRFSRVKTSDMNNTNQHVDPAVQNEDMTAAEQENETIESKKHVFRRRLKNYGV